MSGGLIQIVAHGSQDLYLTGTPEITFFKVVYRRHTNFSIESVRINFDDPVGFGLESSLTVPKVGDLIHKTYLEVILPEINLQRLMTNMDSQPAVEEAESNFVIVTDFMSINRKAYVSAFDIFQADNITNSTQIINTVNDIFNEPGNQEIIEDFRILLNNFPTAPFNYDEISMQSIITGFSQGDNKNDIFNAMTIGIDKSIKTQNFFFNDLKTKRETLEDESNENIKFAWVDRIGHAIFEEIEIYIGGQKIDQHLSDWLNVWYELSANRNMEDTYFKMIGNVEELTNFNREVKPYYRLKIPLQFWFCRFSGLAIPLVALEYHDVRFCVRFRKIEQVAYIETGQMVKFSNSNGDGIFLDEVPSELGLNIEATILIDYIYLDDSERRRFAQSSHEYLIEQIQVLEINDIFQDNIQCVLNTFTHPSKELIWVTQKVRFTKNLSGYNRLRWDNYSLTEENKGNPIKFTTIDFHSFNRVPRLDGNYYNYVQPYQHHSTTPSDGINVYSFSIFPEEQQPSGTANLNRLTRVVLFLELDESLFIEPNEEINKFNIRIYTRGNNILRVISGMAGTSYTYG